MTLNSNFLKNTMASWGRDHRRKEKSFYVLIPLAALFFFTFWTSTSTFSPCSGTLILYRWPWLFLSMWFWVSFLLLNPFWSYFFVCKMGIMPNHVNQHQVAFAAAKSFYSFHIFFLSNFHEDMYEAFWWGELMDKWRKRKLHKIEAGAD